MSDGRKYNTRNSLPAYLGQFDDDIQLNPYIPIQREMHKEVTIERGGGCGRGRGRGRGVSGFLGPVNDNEFDPAVDTIEPVGGPIDDNVTGPTGGIDAGNPGTSAAPSAGGLFVDVGSATGTAGRINGENDAGNTSSNTSGSAGNLAADFGDGNATSPAAGNATSPAAGFAGNIPANPGADNAIRFSAGNGSSSAGGSASGTSTSIGGPTVATSAEDAAGSGQGNAGRGGRGNAACRSRGYGRGNDAEAGNSNFYNSQHQTFEYEDYEPYPRQRFYPRET